MGDAAFLLIKTNRNAYETFDSIERERPVRWGSPTYGPHQVVAYVETDLDVELAATVESLRGLPDVIELDARICKPIPEDGEAFELRTDKPVSAVLLITVDHRQEKEREVTLALRGVEGVSLARAMWGPADIIAVVEANDNEELRNLICDQVKTMNGVATNSTLFCYPATDGWPAHLSVDRMADSSFP